MTLTKKSLAFAMALLMVFSLALVAVPQAAQAALPNITGFSVWVIDDTQVQVIFTPPTGASTYAILENGTSQANGVATPNAQMSIAHTLIGTGTISISVKCTDGGANEATTGTISITKGVANLTVSLSYSPSLQFVKYNTADASGVATDYNNTPIKVFYNRPVSITMGFVPGIFSSSLSASASPSSVSTSIAGTTVTTNAITTNTTVSISGGTFVNTPGGNWWNKYQDDTYVALGETKYYGVGDLTYNVNASKYKLDKVGVNRQLLTEGKHYSVASDGSNRVNITLKSDFLNTLPLGYNRFAFSFTDGSAHVEISVKETRPGSGSGSTGASNATALRSLTVYNKASSKGRKLGSYSKGADIRVTGFTSSGSYAIVDFGGDTGYVKADYVNANLADPMTGRTSSSVSLYTRKSTSSKYQYAKVSKNTDLTLLGREGSYWCVLFNDEELFVRAKYVKNLTVG